MKSDIQEHETWQVLDSTKIQSYMRCPRKFFYEYVLGWRSEVPSIHLVFGSSWHLAMEVLHDEGYTAEACAKGYLAAETEYRKSFPPEWDEGNKPKTMANLLRALPQYCERYAEDDFEVLHIEIAGSVAVAEGKLLHFKTDTICRNQQGQVFSLEHKSGGRFSTMWLNQWRQKMQIGVYSHVLYCMFDPQEVYGVIINGAFFANEPKRKLNGELYTNARDNEFHRVPSRRSLQAMEGWLVEVLALYNRILADYDKLAEEDDQQNIMTSFQRNTESCTDYGGCPYLDVCSSWNNPLLHIEDPPVGMHVDFWDPRKHESVREVVEL
jgi:hypothetical protein